MNELVEVMQEILEELRGINLRLDSIQGDGLYNSISDVHDKLDEIQGSGLYNSIGDVHDKLDDVESAISSLETTVTLGSNY